MILNQGSARERDRVDSPEELSPGIPRPTSLGPGLRPGSWILEFRVPVPDTGFSDFQSRILWGSRKSRLSRLSRTCHLKWIETVCHSYNMNFSISGTGTAGSRGPFPGCRALILMV